MNRDSYCWAYSKRAYPIHLVHKKEQNFKLPLEPKAQPSPLLQGGLEIPIEVKIIWSQVEKLLKLLKAKVEEVKYPMAGKYNDDSKSILNENGVHNDEDDDADDDVAHDDDEELLEVEEQYLGDEEDVEMIDIEI